MSKNITNDVYFTVNCSECHNKLNAHYDERNRVLDVEPCECCLKQREEEMKERVKDERN